jgi:Arc/MetJ family transcription regulator
MRTTVTIDDELLARATELTGITEKSALLRDGLETLIRVESAKRLAAWTERGGGAPARLGHARRRSAAVDARQAFARGMSGLCCRVRQRGLRCAGFRTGPHLRIGAERGRSSAATCCGNYSGVVGARAF